MKAKKLIAVIAAIGVVISLTACGSDPSSTSGKEGQEETANEETPDDQAEEESLAEESLAESGETAADSEEMLPEMTLREELIGISLPSSELERWPLDAAFLKSEFGARGFETEAKYAQNDAVTQIEQLKTLVDDGADLLVITPVNRDSLAETLESGEFEGIPVISYDRLILGTERVDYYISYDNYTIGSLQAQYILDKLGLADAADKSVSYNVEFAAGDAKDNNSEIFFEGAKNLLQPYIDQGIINIVSGEDTFEECATPDWSREEALNRFNRIIAGYYSADTKLDALVCANDEIASAAVEALETSYSGENQVIITGQDANEENLAYIVEGKQSMTVFKSLLDEARVTAAVGEAVLDGRTPDETLIEAESWNFKVSYDVEIYNNGKKMVPSYLLGAVSVDAENMKKELVDEGYYSVDTEGYFSIVAVDSLME